MNITDKPLISVILPIYNVEDFLEKCVETVIQQTYKNLEIILVDDGSTDESGKKAELIKKIDSRIVVFHKKNGGLSDARNFGIKRAKGDYITCIDSDDYVDEDYIEYLYILMEKYGTKMSVCQHRVISEKKITDYGSQGDEILSPYKCIERMLYHDIIDTSAWAKLYHKSMFDDVKYPKGMLFEDIATTYKLFLKCENIAIGYESKYSYIIRKSSIVNGEFNAKKFDLLKMTDYMAKDVYRVFPELAPAIIRRRVYARFSTLNQMIGVKGYDIERKNIIKFIKKYKWNVLCNNRAPRRDKAAIIILYISYWLYAIIWRLYKN